MGEGVHRMRWPAYAGTRNRKSQQIESGRARKGARTVAEQFEFPAFFRGRVSVRGVSTECGAVGGGVEGGVGGGVARSLAGYGGRRSGHSPGPGAAQVSAFRPATDFPPSAVAPKMPPGSAGKNPVRGKVGSQRLRRSWGDSARMAGGWLATRSVRCRSGCCIVPPSFAFRTARERIATGAAGSLLRLTGCRPPSILMACSRIAHPLNQRPRGHVGCR